MEKMKLYVRGVEAYVGMPVVDFRGKPYVLSGWSAPLHSSSSGRVYIMDKDSACEREYYPGAIGGDFK